MDNNFDLKLKLKVMKTLQKSRNHYSSLDSLLQKAILHSFLLILSLNAFSGEKPIKSENPKWNVVQKDDEIELYDRWIDLPDGRKTRERKGVFYVNNNIEDILKLVTTADGVKTWMSGVKESNDVGENMVYVLFNVPWPFKDKDLVAEINTSNIPGFQSKKVHYSAVADYLPLNEDAERLKSYEATWTLTMIEPGRIQVSFTAFSDTPPIAPKWIQDPITAKLFKDNLLKLRELLIELDYNILNALNQ